MASRNLTDLNVHTPYKLFGPQPAYVIGDKLFLLTWSDSKKGGCMIREDSLAWLKSHQDTHQCFIQATNKISGLRLEIPLSELPDRPFRVYGDCDGFFIYRGDFEQFTSLSQETHTLIVPEPQPVNSVHITEISGYAKSTNPSFSTLCAGVAKKGFLGPFLRDYAGNIYVIER
jgi:hypothetical protein|tara:strand:- start:885 stop:1403 length:519 start_codon:yes stop_codon:yes gene_type:complete